MTPLEYDAARIWHPYAALGRAPVLHAKSASGLEIELADGSRLVDAVSSWWCVAHGHNHPAIVEAIRRQSERMCHVMFGGFTHDPAVELAERLQDVGIKALTIHGRTRAQMYTGQADWTLIGKVKENPRMKIPIIGNGDITTPERAKECFDRYGVDAIMIGRGSFGRPWIFEEVKHYLKTGEKWQDPGFQWKMDVLKQETLDSIARLDERRGIVHIRRHLAASPLFKGLEDFRHTRIEMLRAETVSDLFAIMDHISAQWGSRQSVPQQPDSEASESISAWDTPLK